jgi:hypothetical protein
MSLFDPCWVRLNGCSKIFRFRNLRTLDGFRAPNEKTLFCVPQALINWGPNGV